MKRGPKKGRAQTPPVPASPDSACAAKPQSRTRGRWLLWLVGTSALVGIGILVWVQWFGPQADEEKDFPAPGYSASGFLNTRPEARYVGINACVECHQSKHQSFLLTAHSQAFADVNPIQEPPDGQFVHAASGREYRVYRHNGQLRHEEVARSADGKEVSRIDHPVRYRIGSGRFGRTYLIDVDGFLFESPITWYTSKNQWGMSPGYDLPSHMSFERPIPVTCLGCHGGLVETAQAIHRPTLKEKTIGCEKCHGPGSLHVETRKSGKVALGDEDLTIVNPGKLSRPVLEAICASCHLFGPARVYLRGRAVGDFRPGMPTSDYFIDYHFDAGAEEMTVVGHMEQLRRSKCYQKNEQLTCLTCHDSHRAQPKDSTAYFRQKCMRCHTEQSCRVDPMERRKTTGADRCVACHMPRGKTDIPHVTFTHHRIGVHKANRGPAVHGTPQLDPTESIAHLAPIDQKRNLGLAYMHAARQPECAGYAGAFTNRARELLVDVYTEGLRDAETSAALANLFLPIDPERSRAFAREALKAKALTDEPHADALVLLAAGELQNQNFEAATDLLKKLVSLRRSGEDWAMLGISYQLRRMPREAVPALQTALSMRPDQPAIHFKLADAYRDLGDAERAKEYRDKGLWWSQKQGK